MDLLFNITKEYPTFFKVLIYKEPIIINHPTILNKRKHNAFVTLQSVKRTKRSIDDICMCNIFDNFMTFTFDKRKVDRYSRSVCSHKVTTFFRSARTHHSPELKYLIVPEFHKDGAIHFHALVSGYNGYQNDSGRKSSTGRPIYNLVGWRYGYSTSVHIDDQDKVRSYVKKYITKDLMLTPGVQRYFVSNNVVRPTIKHNSRVSDIVKNITPTYSDQYYDYYFVQK